MLESGALEKAVDVEAQPVSAEPLPPPFEGPVRAKTVRCLAAIDMAFYMTISVVAILSIGIFIDILVRDFKQIFYSSDLNRIQRGSLIATIFFMFFVSVLLAAVALLECVLQWKRFEKWEKNREERLAAVKE